MTLVTRVRLAVLCLLVFAALPPYPARAATYLPLSDEDLAERARVIVRARVVAQEVRVATSGGRELPATRTRFEPVEILKGSITSETFSIELPGGDADGLSYRVPGTPTFSPDEEVILFVSPDASPETDRFLLTEFGLSKFDIVTDANGRRFAVRPAFEAQEDALLARRGDVAAAGRPARDPLRDA